MTSKNLFLGVSTAKIFVRRISSTENWFVEMADNRTLLPSSTFPTNHNFFNFLHSK